MKKPLNRLIVNNYHAEKKKKKKSPEGPHKEKRNLEIYIGGKTHRGKNRIPKKRSTLRLFTRQQ